MHEIVCEDSYVIHVVIEISKRDAVDCENVAIIGKRKHVVKCVKRVLRQNATDQIRSERRISAFYLNLYILFMGTCYCCKTTVTDSDIYKDDQHKSCANKLHKRIHDRLCIYCGVELNEMTFKQGTGWHVKCNVTPEVYYGFPYQ